MAETRMVVGRCDDRTTENKEGTMMSTGCANGQFKRRCDVEVAKINAVQRQIPRDTSAPRLKLKSVTHHRTRARHRTAG